MLENVLCCHFIDICWFRKTIFTNISKKAFICFNYPRLLKFSNWFYDSFYFIFWQVPFIFQFWLTKVLVDAFLEVFPCPFCSEACPFSIVHSFPILMIIIILFIWISLQGLIYPLPNILSFLPIMAMLVRLMQFVIHTLNHEIFTSGLCTFIFVFQNSIQYLAIKQFLRKLLLVSIFFYEKRQLLF